MTALNKPTLTLEMPVAFRLATYSDLPKLEWYGQYTHFRALFRRTYQEQLQHRRLMLVADCNNFPIGHIFIQLSSERAAYLRRTAARLSLFAARHGDVSGARHRHAPDPRSRRFSPPITASAGRRLPPPKTIRAPAAFMSAWAIASLVKMRANGATSIMKIGCVMSTNLVGYWKKELTLR